MAVIYDNEIGEHARCWQLGWDSSLSGALEIGSSSEVVIDVLLIRSVEGVTVKSHNHFKIIP